MKHLWDKSGAPATDRAWADRFTSAADRHFDARLVEADLWTNAAHARVLHQAGVLDRQETDALLAELRRLEHQGLHLTDEDEDVHSAVEKALTDALGAPGKRIHTARSRNDQVLTDIRIFVRDALNGISDRVLTLIDQLKAMGERDAGILYAGVTHTQPAMPLSTDAWAAGYADQLLQDLHALREAYRTANRSPLGTAAGFGTPYFELDRDAGARWLAFAEVQRPVAAAQLSRGPVESRVLDACGYLAGTLNRMAADLVWMAHPAQAFVRLSDDQTTGSSIMPQKRNPDVWELIRAGVHQVAGYQQTVRGLHLGLVSGYHRDLQVLKQAVVLGTDTTRDLCDAAVHALRGTRFDAASCAASLTPDVWATHHANRLVREGWPFRDAYRRTAEDLAEGRVGAGEAGTGSWRNAGEPGRPVWPDTSGIRESVIQEKARIQRAKSQCFG